MFQNATFYFNDLVLGEYSLFYKYILFNEYYSYTQFKTWQTQPYNKGDHIDKVRLNRDIAM